MGNECSCPCSKEAFELPEQHIEKFALVET